MQKPDPVELVGIHVGMLAEAVAVVLFIAMMVVFVALGSGA